jgi:spermidine synthase
VTTALPFILLLFIGSGAAALIYEIVWFQMLTLVLGSSAVSVGVLLATFMGGMCLGSYLLPRFVSARHHPLRVYALLEIGIGAFGVLLLLLMPIVGRVYTSWGGYGLTGFLLRGIVASICLLPPTLAMGATLPAVSRWVETTPRGVAWLGFFYAGNIVGAVAGSLLAGFYLLRVYDVTIATFVAAAINAAVGVLGLVLATRIPYSPAAVAGLKPGPATAGPATVAGIGAALATVARPVFRRATNELDGYSTLKRLRYRSASVRSVSRLNLAYSASAIAAALKSALSE